MLQLEKGSQLDTRLYAYPVVREVVLRCTAWRNGRIVTGTASPSDQ
nr:MAG TPA: hypothetical protein [Caudoviricetes sp.]